MENLTKAKAQLILDQPFFASLLFSMPMIEDGSLPTLATNGEEIRYNPVFLSKLTVSETVFVLAHETLHCVFQHMTRRGSRDANRWNIAADYVINETLITEKIGAMPAGCLRDSGLVKQGNGTTEGVYNLLPEESEEKKSGADHGNGGAMDTVEDAAGDEATQAQKDAEMRVKIVQAGNAARMMGKLSAGMERIVKGATRSKTDWKAILRRFLTERTKTDWTYAKPKRRFLADEIYLPGLTGEKLESVVIAIDCSGSIDEKLLAEFAAEIKGIIEDTSPTAAHVVYFDSEVLKHDTFTAEDAVEVKPIGGGGTAFEPIWKFISEKDLNPAACVVLTDLYGSFGNAPEFPVLWASISDQTAPFGETVRL